MAVRITDFCVQLVTTMPEVPAPAPKAAFAVDFVTAELPYGEWALLVLQRHFVT
jgi:hypothetical protein